MYDNQSIITSQKKDLREFIVSRLNQYWEFAGLPTKYILPLVEILEKNSDNSMIAKEEVRKNIPEINQYNSIIHRKLRLFRGLKIRRLSKRIFPFIKDLKIILDLGGQTPDLAEFLLSKSNIEKFYVSDINPPRILPKDNRVEYIIQPTPGSTGLPDQSVDAIIVSMVFHHIDYQERHLLLNHISKILKPKGVIIVIEDTFLGDIKQKNKRVKLINTFNNFSAQEKYQLISFFDWFGNRLLRNHTSVPLPFTFETLEGWKNIFYRYNFKINKIIVIDDSNIELDLMPPKAIFVFQKIKKINQKNSLSFNDEKIMEKAISFVDSNTKPFPLHPLSKVGCLITDTDHKILSSAVNGFGQQHAERLALLKVIENSLRRRLEKGEYFSDLKKIRIKIALLGILLKVSSKFPESELEEFSWLNQRLGNLFSGTRLYVNLEPCPRCAKIISSIGIKHVIYGATDVHRTTGHLGHNILAKEGINIIGGVCEKNAIKQNIIPFFLLNNFFEIYLYLREIHRKVFSLIMGLNYSNKLKKLKNELTKQNNIDKECLIAQTLEKSIQYRGSTEKPKNKLVKFKNNCQAFIPNNSDIKIDFHSVKDITLVYDGFYNTTFIIPTNLFNLSNPLENVCRIPVEITQNYFLNAMEVSDEDGSWEFHRESSNGNHNFWYIKNNLSYICFPETNNVTAVVDSGLVIARNLQDISIIKIKNSIEIFIEKERDLFNRIIEKNLSLKKIEYIVPEHIQDRLSSSYLSNNEVKEVLKKYYTILPSKIFDISERPGAVLKIITKDKTYVLRSLGDDPFRAQVLSQFSKQSKFFPKIIISNTNEYILSFKGFYYCLEEFIDSKKQIDLNDPHYYCSLAKHISSFHEESSNIKNIKELSYERPTRSTLDNISLSLNLREKLLFDYKNILKLIRENICLLKKSNLFEAYDLLSKQVVHRDLSAQNILYDLNNNFHIIDAEHLCYAPRIMDIPLVLVGRGSGNPLTYIKGSFDIFIKSYNTYSKTPFSQIEIALINYLIRYRFIMQLEVALIKRKNLNGEVINNTFQSFLCFCDENSCDIIFPCKTDEKKFVPIPVYIPYISFNIPRPIKLIENEPINKELSKDLLLHRLDRNMYYIYSHKDIKEEINISLGSLQGLARFILNYFSNNYPDLKIINISIFGSYLYSSNPSDIDILILVDGNKFGLEEIDFDVNKFEWAKGLKHSIKSLGFSIKGIKNFENGVFDSQSLFSQSSQVPVIDRTTSALFDRHLVIWGEDFKNNNLLKPNLFAQISDLLNNTYLRYYLIDNKKPLSEYEKARKILVRLYETSIYFSILGLGELSPKEIQKTRDMFETKKIVFKDVEKLFLKEVKVFNELIKHSLLLRQCSTEISVEDELNLRELIDLANNKIETGELGSFLPVVAKITHNGKNIATSTRTKFLKANNFGVNAVHAEIEAIRSAEIKGFTAWQEATLYVSLDPCLPCSRILTEFYQFNRIYYGIKDLTLAPYSRNINGYVDNGVTICECTNNSIRKDLYVLFSNLFGRKKIYHSEFRLRYSLRESLLCTEFREAYQLINKKDVQVLLFDSTLWAEIDNYSKDSYIFRHLFNLKQGLNPKKDFILLITGEKDSIKLAFKEITELGLFESDKILIIPNGFLVKDYDKAGKKIFVFDYDGTLAFKGEPISQEVLSLISQMLLSNQEIAILTQRTNKSFSKIFNIEDDILKILKDITNNDIGVIKSLISNLSIFTSRGSEKHFFEYKNKKIDKVLDRVYTKVFSEKEKLELIKIIKSVLLSNNVDKDLDTEVGLKIEPQGILQGYVQIRIRFKEDSFGHKTINKVQQQINDLINLTNIKFSIDFSGKSIIITPGNKKETIEFLLRNGYKKIEYFGDDPVLGDRGVLETSKLNPDQVYFHKVENHKETLMMMQKILSDIHLGKK